MSMYTYMSESPLILFIINKQNSVQLKKRQALA